MITILLFSATLLVGVYISSYANRSILSTAVLFLVVGFFSGEGMGDLITFQPRESILKVFSELALFSVLFTDGLEVDLKKLFSTWRLPARALAFGLPLTMLGTAALAHFILDINWLESLLLGAVLAPTDPVLVSAIVGRERVPRRLRDLLNIESGFNDGLALPFVVILLSIVDGSAAHYLSIAAEVALGIAIGVAVPWMAVKVEKFRYFSAAPFYERFLSFAVAVFIYAITDMIHANKFLAAFSAGITIATISGDFRTEFKEFGENITELLKLAALLLFGAMLSIEFMHQIGWMEILFIMLVLIAVRPAALSVSFFGTDLPDRQRLAALWFGPKGFASVVYSLLVLNSDAPDNDKLFHISAMVIAASILLHSSTDVPFSRWLVKE